MATNPSKDVMRQPLPQGGDQASPQDLMNQSFDPVLRTFVVQLLGSGGYLSSSDSTGSLYTAPPPLALRIDDYTTPSVTYLGKASVGTATSAASWQIARIDQTSGTVFTWADGDANFNNVWDNRASLSYS